MAGNNQSDAQLRFNASLEDNVSPSADKLEKKLKSLGMSQAQIKVVVNAVDNASQHIDTVQKKLDGLPRKTIVHIHADAQAATESLGKFKQHAETVRPKLSFVDNLSEVTDKIFNLKTKIPLPLAGAIPGMNMLYAGGGAGLGIGAIAGIAGTLQKSMAVNSSMEQSMVTLTQTLKDSTKAQGEMGKLVKIAQTTPFQYQDVLQADVRLRSYAIPTMKGEGGPGNQGWLKTSGDMAAALNTPITQAVEAIADARQGYFIRMMSYGIRMMREDFQAGGKYAGMTYEQGLTKALKRFEGAQEMQSKTFQGIMSNLKDVSQQNIIKPIGAPLFEVAKQQANTLQNQLIGTTPQAQKFQDMLGEKMQQAQRLMVTLYNLIGRGQVIFKTSFEEPLLQIGKILVDIGKKFAMAFGGTTFTVIKAVAQGLYQITKPILTIIDKMPGLVQMFGIFKALSMLGFDGIAGPFMNIFGALLPFQQRTQGILRSFLQMPAAVLKLAVAWQAMKWLDARQATKDINREFDGSSTRLDKINAKISDMGVRFGKSTTAAKHLVANIANMLPTGDVDIRLKQSMQIAERSEGIANKTGDDPKAVAEMMIQAMRQANYDFTKQNTNLDRFAIEVYRASSVADHFGASLQDVQRVMTEFKSGLEGAGINTPTGGAMIAGAQQMLAGIPMTQGQRDSGVRSPDDLLQMMLKNYSQPSLATMQRMGGAAAMPKTWDFKAPGTAGTTLLGLDQPGKLRDWRDSRTTALANVRRSRELQSGDALTIDGRKYPSLKDIAPGSGKPMQFANPMLELNLGLTPGHARALTAAAPAKRAQMLETDWAKYEQGLKNITKAVDDLTQKQNDLNAVQLNYQTALERSGRYMALYQQHNMLPLQRQVEDINLAMQSIQVEKLRPLEREMTRLGQAQSYWGQKMSEAQYSMSKWTSGLLKGEQATLNQLHAMELYNKQLSLMQLQYTQIGDDLGTSTIRSGYSSRVEPLMGFSLQNQMQKLQKKQAMKQLQYELGPGEQHYQLGQASRSENDRTERSYSERMAGIKSAVPIIDEATRKQHALSLQQYGLQRRIDKVNEGLADQADKVSALNLKLTKFAQSDRMRQFQDEQTALQNILSQTGIAFQQTQTNIDRYRASIDDARGDEKIIQSLLTPLFDFSANLKDPSRALDKILDIYTPPSDNRGAERPGGARRDQPIRTRGLTPAEGGLSGAQIEALRKVKDYLSDAAKENAKQVSTYWTKTEWSNVIKEGIIHAVRDGDLFRYIGDKVGSGGITSLGKKVPGPIGLGIQAAGTGLDKLGGGILGTGLQLYVAGAVASFGIAFARQMGALAITHIPRVRGWAQGAAEIGEKASGWAGTRFAEDTRMNNFFGRMSEWFKGAQKTPTRMVLGIMGETESFAARIRQSLGLTRSLAVTAAMTVPGIGHMLGMITGMAPKMTSATNIFNKSVGAVRHAIPFVGGHLRKLAHWGSTSGKDIAKAGEEVKGAGLASRLGRIGGAAKGLGGHLKGIAGAFGALASLKIPGWLDKLKNLFGDNPADSKPVKTAEKVVEEGTRTAQTVRKAARPAVAATKKAAEDIGEKIKDAAKRGKDEGGFFDLAAIGEHNAAGAQRAGGVVRRVAAAKTRVSERAAERAAASRTGRGLARVLKTAFGRKFGALTSAGPDVVQGNLGKAALHTAEWLPLVGMPLWGAEIAESQISPWGKLTRKLPELAKVRMGMNMNATQMRGAMPNLSSGEANWLVDKQKERESLEERIRYAGEHGKAWQGMYANLQKLNEDYDSHQRIFNKDSYDYMAKTAEASSKRLQDITTLKHKGLHTIDLKGFTDAFTLTDTYLTKLHHRVNSAARSMGVAAPGDTSGGHPSDSSFTAGDSSTGGRQTTMPAAANGIPSANLIKGKGDSKGYLIRVGEEDDEMIIPLAPHRRNRARSLVQHAQGILGFAKGGVAHKARFRDDGDNHGFGNVNTAVAAAWKGIAPSFGGGPMPPTQWMTPAERKKFAHIGSTGNILAQGGEHAGGITYRGDPTHRDGVVLDPSVKRLLKDGSSEGVQILLHEWAHYFQKGSLLKGKDHSLAEAGADAFSMKAVRRTVKQMNRRGGDFYNITLQPGYPALAKLGKSLDPAYVYRGQFGRKFASGGIALHGHASTYGNDPSLKWVDHGDNNIPALPGATNNKPGIAVMRNDTLGGYWKVHSPFGKTAVVQQTDIGPAPSTRRVVDINAVAARTVFGKSAPSFPTDKGNWDISYLGKHPTGEAISKAKKHKKNETLYGLTRSGAGYAGTVGAFAGGGMIQPKSAGIDPAYIAARNIMSKIPSFAAGGFSNAVGAHIDTPAERQIASDLAKLGRSLGVTFSPAGPRSARRTPSENIAVGGATGSNHLAGRAMDVAPDIIKTISNSVLHRFGLNRPMPGAWTNPRDGSHHDERNHIQLLSDGGGSVGGAVSDIGVSLGMSSGMSLGQLPKLPKSLLRSAAGRMMYRTLRKFRRNILNSGSGGGMPNLNFTGGGSNTANQQLGKRMAAAMGWKGTQWEALRQLWTGESGWSTTADNPSSDAYGIPQSLPGSKMASAGRDWRTNPATQIKWGLGYIKSRYGTPAAAWAAWNQRSPHWYHNPSAVHNIGEDQLARLQPGQMVLGKRVSQKMAATIASATGGTAAPTAHRNTLETRMKALRGRDQALKGGDTAPKWQKIIEEIRDEITKSRKHLRDINDKTEKKKAENNLDKLNASLREAWAGKRGSAQAMDSKLGKQLLSEGDKSGGEATKAKILKEAKIRRKIMAPYERAVTRTTQGVQRAARVLRKAEAPLKPKARKTLGRARQTFIKTRRALMRGGLTKTEKKKLTTARKKYTAVRKRVIKPLTKAQRTRLTKADNKYIAAVGKRDTAVRKRTAAGKRYEAGAKKRGVDPKLFAAIKTASKSIGKGTTGLIQHISKLRTANSSGHKATAARVGKLASTAKATHAATKSGVAASKSIHAETKKNVAQARASVAEQKKTVDGTKKADDKRSKAESAADKRERDFQKKALSALEAIAKKDLNVNVHNEAKGATLTSTVVKSRFRSR